METKKKIKCAIFYEPFGYPILSYGLYEINDYGIVRELARAQTREEAEQLYRRLCV
jgi:hypothetical protein